MPKSYRAPSKKRRSKQDAAASRVGASPGRKVRNISRRAPSCNVPPAYALTLSRESVLRKYRSSCSSDSTRTSISETFASMSRSNSISDNFVFASSRTSPVPSLITGSTMIRPTTLCVIGTTSVLLNNLSISASVSQPSARKRTVANIFFFRSNLTWMQSFESNSNSIHAPR